LFLIKALILGVVQGITEFLPISSTAHLILFPWLFGWDDPLLNSLTFDVMLHFGTLVAVIVYFRHDWLKLLRGFLGRDMSDPYGRLSWMVVVGTIPAAILGVLFEDYIESVLRSPLVIVFTLTFVGLLMVVAELKAKNRDGEDRDETKMGFGHAIIIGLAQASALIPGVSRSGATITAGLWSGYKRDGAARFSFLLSTPVIAGACLLKIPEAMEGMQGGDAGAYIIGTVAAAISGYAAIAFLIAYLKRRPLYVFTGYRILLAAVILVVYFMRAG
jgi:undecaprenyl-diphosphatase